MQPEERATFAREARLLREFCEADGFVPLLDASVDPPFIVMPLLEGGTLEERIKRTGPLPVGEAVALVARLADAIGKAHERGVVHRDLKPGNVLLTKKASRSSRT